MYTTLAYYSGDVQDAHKNLQTYKFSDGYAVEEKGLFIGDLSDCIQKQKNRFIDNPLLLRIDISGVDGERKTIMRPGTESKSEIVKQAALKAGVSIVEGEVKTVSPEDLKGFPK